MKGGPKMRIEECTDLPVRKSVEAQSRSSLGNVSGLDSDKKD